MQNVTDLVSLAKPGMGDIHVLLRSSERVRLCVNAALTDFVLDA